MTKKVEKNTCEHRPESNSSKRGEKPKLIVCASRRNGKWDLVYSSKEEGIKQRLIQMSCICKKSVLVAEREERIYIRIVLQGVLWQLSGLDSKLSLPYPGSVPC